MNRRAFAFLAVTGFSTSLLTAACVFNAHAADGRANPGPLPENQKPWWPSRYGPDDQLGTLNEVTPSVTQSATALVKTGTVVDLGRVLDEDTPKFPGRFWHQSVDLSAHFTNPRRPGLGGRSREREAPARPGAAERTVREGQAQVVSAPRIRETEIRPEAQTAAFEGDCRGADGCSRTEPSATVSQPSPDAVGKGWGKNEINWITEIQSGTFQGRHSARFDRPYSDRRPLL